MKVTDIKLVRKFLKATIKHIVSSERIKDALHTFNTRLAAREPTDRITAVANYCEDAAELIAVYSSAFANDGKMDDCELLAVTNKCDELVDRYVGDDAIDALLDAILK